MGDYIANMAAMQVEFRRIADLVLAAEFERMSALKAGSAAPPATAFAEAASAPDVQGATGPSSPTAKQAPISRKATLAIS